MSGKGILSAGRIYCDLNFSGIDQLPELGREVFAEQLSLHAGGGAFITAAYLAALGKPSSLMGRLPAQPFAEIIKSEAQSQGVDLQHCVVAEDGAPQLTVAMSLSGDRAFLTRRQGPALPDDHERQLQNIGAAASTAHLHISELSTLLEYPSLLSQARRTGLSVSLDCAWDEASFDHPDLAVLLSQVDVFLPNDSEMARLRSIGIAEVCAPVTVVKQGAAGATAHVRADDIELHASAPVCEVVDTIGAGDAFNAGFLSAWLERQPLSRCLAIGNACGALAAGRRGGAGELPDLRYLLESE